jgi:hypothetical protein
MTKLANVSESALPLADPVSTGHAPSMRRGDRGERPFMTRLQHEQVGGNGPDGMRGDDHEMRSVVYGWSRGEDDDVSSFVRRLL